MPQEGFVYTTSNPQCGAGTGERTELADPKKWGSWTGILIKWESSHCTKGYWTSGRNHLLAQTSLPWTGDPTRSGAQRKEHGVQN